MGAYVNKCVLVSVEDLFEWKDFATIFIHKLSGTCTYSCLCHGFRICKCIAAKRSTLCMDILLFAQEMHATLTRGMPSAHCGVFCFILFHFNCNADTSFSPSFPTPQYCARAYLQQKTGKVFNHFLLRLVHWFCISRRAGISKERCKRNRNFLPV